MAEQLLGGPGKLIVVAHEESVVDVDIAPLDVPERAQFLSNLLDAHRRAGRTDRQEPHPGHACGGLRATPQGNGAERQ